MNGNIPLAERLRPSSLDDYIGQRHLVGENGIIRKMIESGRITSFILWGPPGVGKTTLAKIIAAATEASFFTLSAVTSGVKDVRDVLEKCKAEASSMFTKVRPILFIDEIHRFSKNQQDFLLGAVEQGIVTLIGATTENPSFEVIRPLLSRTQVYTLKPLDIEDMETLLRNALTRDPVLKERDASSFSKYGFSLYGNTRRFGLIPILQSCLHMLTKWTDIRKIRVVPSISISLGLIIFISVSL